jgi:very-short-patch-repair endonuclease
MKKFDKEAIKQRLRKLGATCSDETKLKLSEKAIDRGIKFEKRTGAEIKVTQLLKNIKNIVTYEQVGFKIYNANEYIKGYIVDYRLNIVGAKYPIILEVDSEYHHNKFSEIVINDNLRNNFLCSFGFVVIRVDSESISEENLQACIDEAKSAYRPTIIKFNKGLVKETPGKIDGNNYTYKLIMFNPITKQVVSM